MNNEKLIQSFNEKINEKLLPKWKNDSSGYGCVYDVGFTDELLKMSPTNIRKNCPRIKDFVNGHNSQPKYIAITTSNFERYFDTNLITFENLCGDVYALVKELRKLEVEKGKHATEVSIAVTGEMQGEGEVKTRTFNFFSNYAGNKYGKGDDFFVFDRLYKDCENNLFIMLGKENEEKLFSLEFKPNTERTLLGNSISENTQFWPAFWRTFDDHIDSWITTIKESFYTYSVEDFEKISFEKILIEKGIPRLFLECIRLSIRHRKIEAEKRAFWVFEGADVALNAGNQNTAFNAQNKIKVFSENLMQTVDIARVPKIPIYSNNENEIAVKHIQYAFPREGIKRSEMPQLPPTWEKFLGNGRFFDPIMDKMKIACFVINVLNAKYDGRQVLVIGGEGEDGKGVFLDVLGNLIGPEHSIPINNSAFSDEDSFGLQNVVNKKFIYLSDCKSVSKLFSENKFKALTGGDTIPINRKNLKIVQWKPQGLCVAVATNNNFYVNSEHGRSRTIPVVFRKNFTRDTMIAKNELVTRLLSEKDEFIQWCADYRYWLNTLICGGRLLKGSSLTVCCDEDMKRLAKGEEIENFELFKGCCEKQQLNGMKFCSWNERSEAEEYVEENVFEIFDEVFDVNAISVIKNDGKVYAKPVDVLTAINNRIYFDDRKDFFFRMTSLELTKPLYINNKILQRWFQKTFKVMKGERVNGKQFKHLLLVPKEMLVKKHEESLFDGFETDFEVTSRKRSEMVQGLSEDELDDLINQ